MERILTALPFNADELIAEVGALADAFLAELKLDPLTERESDVLAALTTALVVKLSEDRPA